MSRENLIVDMQSPTPIDVYRYSSKGVVDISFYRGNSSSYSIEVKTSSTKPILLENCSSSMLQVWNLIEMFREKANRDNKIVNVYDVDSHSVYKKITLATTLNEKEIQEALERQSKLVKSTRRRMVVGTPYHSRKRKKIDSRLIRPILREEKTW